MNNIATHLNFNKIIIILLGVILKSTCKENTETIPYKHQGTVSHSHTEQVTNLSNPTNFNVSDNWQFINLSDTISLKIISHYKALIKCGDMATSSETIGTTETGDTLRVLELCNTKKNFKAGEIVNVKPADKPEFKVNYPAKTFEDTSKRIEANYFDISVLTTTYGIVEKIETKL